jgi:CheY-like chemotaxis protein
MSRILLVDDSPHAQRMGERILSEDGYEVVTVSNADSALIRLDDVDPDVVIADTVMPGRTGYEICQYVKMNPRLRHVRVILTAGVLENFDEEHSKKVEADGTLKKPFRATVVGDSEATRGSGKERQGARGRGRGREAAFGGDECRSFRRGGGSGAGSGRSHFGVRWGDGDDGGDHAPGADLAAGKPPAAPASEPAEPEPPPPANTPIMETVRRVNTLRGRSSSSILGLDIPPAGE